MKILGLPISIYWGDDYFMALFENINVPDRLYAQMTFDWKRYLSDLCSSLERTSSSLF